MRRRAREVAVHGATLTILAWVVHFAWENAQCPLFFEHGSYDASLEAMAIAAAGDVVLTWLVYAVIAAASRRWRWSAERAWTLRQWALLMGLAIALGVAIERHALATGRWSYTDAAPRLPFVDVSMVPIMQLMVLLPVSFTLADRLTRRLVGGPAPDETEGARRRYDRMAPFYDAMEWFAERGAFSRWRRDLWSRVGGERVLEAGVGTGKNLPYHPAEAEVVAMDLSPAMLERARRRAERLGVDITLDEGDVEDLPYQDGSFDVAVATFLFCSVPHPVQGLRELRRVLRPGGRLILLEHVLSRKPILGTLMRWLDTPVHRMVGAHIARDTVGNVEAAGFEIVRVEELAGDVVKRIEARPATAQGRERTQGEAASGEATKSS
ncbi:MAG: class I SAM-dependent methyltransferase [Myxococcota bacterium]